jgi:hypothetical protein
MYDSEFVAAKIRHFEELSGLRVSNLRTVNCIRIHKARIRGLGSLCNLRRKVKARRPLHCWKWLGGVYLIWWGGGGDLNRLSTESSGQEWARCGSMHSGGCGVLLGWTRGAVHRPALRLRIRSTGGS